MISQKVQPYQVWLTIEVLQLVCGIFLSIDCQYFEVKWPCCDGTSLWFLEYRVYHSIASVKKKYANGWVQDHHIRISRGIARLPIQYAADMADLCDVAKLYVGKLVSFTIPPMLSPNSTHLQTVRVLLYNKALLGTHGIIKWCNMSISSLYCDVKSWLWIQHHRSFLFIMKLHDTTYI